MITDVSLGWEETRDDEMSDIRWNEMKWNKMRWNEMRWNELKLEEVGKKLFIWNKIKWNLISMFYVVFNLIRVVLHGPWAKHRYKE